MWKGIMMAVGLVAFVGCETTGNLSGLSDQELARKMDHACDGLPAFSQRWTPQMSFDANVLMQPLIQAMEPRTNVRLQYIRKYMQESVLGDTKKLREACYQAHVYALGWSIGPGMEPEDVHAMERRAEGRR